MRRCRFCRLNNFFIRGIQPPVSNIFPYRAGKKMRILQNHRDIFPQLLPVHPADIDAVHRDRAALYIIKTVDQIRDRRFSGSRRADKGDLLSRLRIERNILQNHLPRLIAERHMVKHHLTADRRDRNRIRRICRLRFRIQHCKHALRACQRRKYVSNLHGKLVDRSGKLPRKT